MAPPRVPRQRKRPILWVATALLLACWIAGDAGRARSEEVTIFAAASTTNAVTDLANAFAQRGSIGVRPVFAASSTLAKQIVHGAPADLFLSASLAWMDYLETKDALAPGSRVDLMRNRLVLIAPSRSALALTVAPGFPLAEALAGGRLAIGDPAHVPAGIYAKSALESLGVWDAVGPQAAAAANVRAALALVERGAAAAGIVYATDAALSRRVRVVAAFPAENHPPIVYPLALVSGRDGPAARALHSYLQGAEAAGIFRSHGFVAAGPTD